MDRKTLIKLIITIVLLALMITLHVLIKNKSISNDNLKKETPILKENEVFHISNNIHTYNEANDKCKMHGARLATEEEVRRAYDNGANWCNYGWTEGQKALFPAQKESVEEALKLHGKKNNPCQKVGVNGGVYKHPYYRFGVNCYGVKPPMKEKNVELRNKEEQKKILVEVSKSALNEKHRIARERSKNRRLQNLRDNLDDDIIVDYNNTKNRWSKTQ